VRIETIGFAKNHLHIVSSNVMGQLKSQSAALLRKKFICLGKVYWNENIVWSPKYFVSSVGVDEETMRKYVEYQGKQDSRQLRMEL